MIKQIVFYKVVCDCCGKEIETFDYYPTKEDITNVGAVKTKRHVYCTENCKRQKMMQVMGNKQINNI
jgi:hypothetical protein